MTKLLERALQKMQGLTETEQDALATLILEELMIPPETDREGIALAYQRDAQIESGETNVLTHEEFGRLTQ